MHVTKFTDYSLRVLIYLGSKPGDELTTISEISTAYSISKHHIRMVVHKLGQLGYINCIQGKGGGFELAIDPNEILVGEVVKNTETDFHLVECFTSKVKCPIAGVCRLQYMFADALEAFFETLNQYTLKDIIKNKRNIIKALETAA